MSSLNKVRIVLSKDKTGDTYEARSYPKTDRNKINGDDYYRVPVYKLRLERLDKGGNVTNTIPWTVLRFMPFYSGRKKDPRYRGKGFLVKGLRSSRKGRVRKYKASYQVRNTPSPFDGAIVIVGAAYIHAGPRDLAEIGWGSAGCAEVIGNFTDFKADIVFTQAGVTSGTVEEGMATVVKKRKLYFKVEPARPPTLTIEAGT